MSCILDAHCLLVGWFDIATLAVAMSHLNCVSVGFMFSWVHVGDFEVFLLCLFVVSIWIHISDVWRVLLLRPSSPLASCHTLHVSQFV